MGELGPWAIVGCADAVPARGEPSDTYWQGNVSVARSALQDAGLGVKDIDGLVFARSGYPLSGTDFPTTFAQAMGLGPAWLESAAHGGAQTSSPIWRAAVGLEAGMASAVLVVSSDNRMSRLTRGGVVGRIASQNVDREFEYHHGPIFPSFFALLAQRHMHEHGTTSEQMARVAVSQRRWAALHPAALMTEQLTVEDVLASRMISSPLHLLDICLVTDGGVAFVMVPGERAHDYTDHPVFLTGFGDCGESQSISYLDGFTDTPILTNATQTALRMSGLDVTDMDVIYPYDPSTFHVLWALESMGFCKRGEAGALVDSGRLDPGGDLPSNTHGGLLSYCHPGMPGSLMSVVEAVRQLRGQAGHRQVPGARNALTQAMGGFMTVGVNIFSSEAS